MKHYPACRVKRWNVGFTKTKDVATVRSSMLLAKLELEDLNLYLFEKKKALLVWVCGAF